MTFAAMAGPIVRPPNKMNAVRIIPNFRIEALRGRCRPDILRMAVSSSHPTQGQFTRLGQSAAAKEGPGAFFLSNVIATPGVIHQSREPPLAGKYPVGRALVLDQPQARRRLSSMGRIDRRCYRPIPSPSRAWRRGRIRRIRSPGQRRAGRSTGADRCWCKDEPHSHRRACPPRFAEEIRWTRFIPAPVIEAFFGCPGSPHHAETPVRMGVVPFNREWSRMSLSTAKTVR